MPQRTAHPLGDRAINNGLPKPLMDASLVDNSKAFQNGLLLGLSPFEPIFAIAGDSLNG